MQSLPIPGPVWQNVGLLSSARNYNGAKDLPPVEQLTAAYAIK